MQPVAQICSSWARTYTTHARTEFGACSLLPGQDLLTGFDIGNLKRCPGGATQPPPDHSAPVNAPDCDPSAVPPGP